jgi:hypothetical protein
MSIFDVLPLLAVIGLAALVLLALYISNNHSQIRIFATLHGDDEVLATYVYARHWIASGRRIYRSSIQRQKNVDGPAFPPPGRWVMTASYSNRELECTFLIATAGSAGIEVNVRSDDRANPDWLSADMVASILTLDPKCIYNRQDLMRTIRSTLVAAASSRAHGQSKETRTGTIGEFTYRERLSA